MNVIRHTGSTQTFILTIYVIEGFYNSKIHISGNDAISGKILLKNENRIIKK